MAASAPQVNKKGLSLIEVEIALLVCALTVIGSISFKYFSTKEAVRSDYFNHAGQIACSLLDAWKPYPAASSYDPTYELFPDFVITKESGGPDVPAGLLSLGSYHITLNGAGYYGTLAYQDSSSTAPATLAVGITWPRNFVTQNIDNDPVIWITTHY